MAREPKTTEEVAQDEVVVKKEDLKALMRRVEELERNNGVISLDEPEIRTVRVRLWEGKPVSHMDNVQRTGKVTLQGDEIMLCDIYVVQANGDVKKETVDYLEFIRSCPFEEMQVVETKSEKRELVQGVTEVTQVDGYRTVGTGVKVKNKVISYDYTYTVRTKDGNDVKIKTPNL